MTANAQTPVPSSTKAEAEQISEPTYPRELLLLARTLAISTLSKTQDHQGYMLTARASPKDKVKVCEATPHEQDGYTLTACASPKDKDKMCEATPHEQEGYTLTARASPKDKDKMCEATPHKQESTEASPSRAYRVYTRTKKRAERTRYRQRAAERAREEVRHTMYREEATELEMFLRNTKKSQMWGSTEKDSDDDTVSTAASDTEVLSLMQEIGPPPGLEAFLPHGLA